VEVLSGTLPLSQHKDRCHLRVRCVCNRERVRLYQGSYPDRWNETCGCNGIDHIRIGGDPNLPAQVTTLPELVAWGGWAGMTSFYARKNTVGMSATVQQLSQLAEARHPGEGWRIPRIIPVPGEVLLLTPPMAVAMPALVPVPIGKEAKRGVRNLHVGDKVGEFVVEEVVGSCASRGTMHLRCICGRMRVMALNSAHGLQRTTCGCNGMDTVSVAGDPNLPPGVTTYFALVRWAGVVVPSHHWMAIHKYGLARGIEMLAEVAEKTHPGEGWRIKAILPSPGETPVEGK